MAVSQERDRDRTAPEFDHPTRGRSYSHANSELPSVRALEVEATASLLDPRAGEVVLEFGAGNGLLTGRILRRLANSAEAGTVIAIDNSAFVCQTLRERFSGLDVRLLGADNRLPIEDGVCNAVVSLANFHHVVDKQSMFQEFARVLKPSGRLVVGDVARGTPAARYFDEVVDKICSTGHQHEFIDAAQFGALCAGAGLQQPSWELRSVPWQFLPSPTQSAEEIAGWFLKRIHDAHCREDECFGHAVQYLGFQREGSALQMNWQLAYATALKPAGAR